MTRLATRSAIATLCGVFGGEAADDLYCLDTDADDLADEADDVFFIIRVVGVAGDAAAFVGADLVLVDDPVQRAAVAEAVVEDFGRNLGERQGFVDLQLRLVFGEPHFLDVVGERDAVGFEPLERPGFELFVAEVEVGESFAGFGEGFMFAYAFDLVLRRDKAQEIARH